MCEEKKKFDSTVDAIIKWALIEESKEKNYQLSNEKSRQNWKNISREIDKVGKTKIKNK